MAKKGLIRLLKLNRWHLDMESAEIQRLSAEDETLSRMQKEMEGFIEKETQSFDKAIELHPVMLTFLKNITLRQKAIHKRQDDIAKNKAEKWESLHEIYLQKKQLEKTLEKTLAEDQSKKELDEQKFMDDWGQNRRKR